MREAEKDEKVTIEIEVNQELYDQVCDLCSQMGTTIEAITEEFIRFCANADNIPIIRKWLEI